MGSEGKLTAIGGLCLADLPVLVTNASSGPMSERMRGRLIRAGVVHDSRRRSWIVICPAAEFVVPSVPEMRATEPARLPARPFRSQRRVHLCINSIDAFVLTLIAGLYGSLFYCLATVVR